MTFRRASSRLSAFDLLLVSIAAGWRGDYDGFGCQMIEVIQTERASDERDRAAMPSRSRQEFVGRRLEFVRCDDRGLDRPVFRDIRRDLLCNGGEIRGGLPVS